MKNRIIIADDHELMEYKAMAHEYRVLLAGRSGAVTLDCTRLSTRYALNEVVRQVDSAVYEYESRRDGMQALTNSDYPPNEGLRGEKSTKRLVDDADEIAYRVLAGQTEDKRLAHAVRHLARALQRMLAEDEE